MGLFGSNEELFTAEPGMTDIPDRVASSVPDVGHHFLNWLGTPGAERLLPHVEGLRGENGWIPLRKAQWFGINKLSECLPWTVSECRCGPVMVFEVPTSA